MSSWKTLVLMLVAIPLLCTVIYLRAGLEKHRLLAIIVFVQSMALLAAISAVFNIK